MAFENVRAQLSEELSGLWSRFRESSAYNSLRERFEQLPLRIQKLIIASGVAFAILLALMIPYGFVESSSGQIASFEETKLLIRELLGASRNQDREPLTQGLIGEFLVSRIDIALKTAGLIPEQITPATELPASAAPNLAPPGVKQFAAQVALKKLNLKQVVDIGYNLQTLNPSVKVIGVEVKESPGVKAYYDVNYKLLSFIFPQSPDLESADEAPTRGRPNAGRKPQPAENTEDAE